MVYTTQYFLTFFAFLAKSILMATLDAKEGQKLNWSTLWHLRCHSYNTKHFRGEEEGAGAHDSVSKLNMGRQGVNQNVNCHFLSICELNFTTKSIEKAMVFCEIKFVTAHRGTGQCH